MDIQATISKLQSDIKRASRFINWLTAQNKEVLEEAKAYSDDKYFWRNYHDNKDRLGLEVKQQKINKSLYKLMCTIQKQMPNGSISMAQIREL
jgi:hypothetical protein